MKEYHYATDLPSEEIFQTIVDFENEEGRLRKINEGFIILGNVFNSSNETLKQLDHALNLVCIDEVSEFLPVQFKEISDRFYQPVVLDSDGYYHEDSDGYYHEDSDFTSYIPKHGVYCSFIHQHKKEKSYLLRDGFKTVFFHRKAPMKLKTFKNLRF